MRNLQKILALVLALVMSLSLMATAGAREFTDGDQIDEIFAESVDVLTGLDVFQGYPTGDFQPKGEITRAEVAAIIYRIATGDVDDTQVKIYADYNKFSDVPSDNWAAGYINYCANAEYIKGRGDGKFYPQDKVTGYEALAMILRVVGYDKNGEFTGADWQVQTAATANQRKVTKNVNAGTLGTAATRETVAELLCKAILIEKVNYTLAFGYQISTDPKDTIAYETFKMEKLEGVVTGNEIADLKTDKGTALGANQTRLVIDGREEVMNIPTGLDDIGECVRVYIRPENGTTRSNLVTSKVYSDGLNKVYTTSERVGTVGNTTGSEEGITSIEGAEHFINFDQAHKYEARSVIRYVMQVRMSEYEAMLMLATNGGTLTELNFDGNGNGKNNDVFTSASTSDADSWDKLIRVESGVYNYQYENTIKAFDDLTDTDYANIKSIFVSADNKGNWLKGEVYAGTSSIQNKDDISDDIRWEDFITNYLKTEENKEQVESNGQGCWLKIIDNDMDGIAEYVLQTRYTVAKVAANGTGLDIATMRFTDGDTCNEVSASEKITVVKGTNLEASEDTVAAGDVVIYAKIDGVIRAQKAEFESSRVSSINRAVNPVTATIESGEKKQSWVHTHSNGLKSGLTNMVIGTNYTVYFDLYGNIAAFTEGDVGKFVLITDGWFNQTAAAREWAVQAYIDGALQTVNITNNGDLFIKAGDNNNKWGMLKDTEFGGHINTGSTNTNDIHTIVANLEGNNLVPVDKSYLYSQTVRMLDMKNNAIPGRSGAKANAYQTVYGPTATAYTALDGEVDVFGRSDTVYYYVYKDTTKNYTTGQDNIVVRSYTGCDNTPSINSMYIEDVYAVGFRTNYNNSTIVPGTNYTADVVVVELNRNYKYTNTNRDQVFIPGATIVNNSAARVAGYGIESVPMILNDGTFKEDVQVDLNHSSGYNRVNSSTIRIEPGLYFMDPVDTNSSIYTIHKMSAADIRANNYLTGYVAQDTIMETNYVRVTAQMPNYVDGVAVGTEDSNLGTQSKTVNTENLYTLSYSGGVANLAKAPASTVFDQWKDRTLNNSSKDKTNELYDMVNDTFLTTNENRNEVIVRYNGTSVVWAISFAEKNGSDQNYAQDVWFNNLIARDEVVNSWVKFFGVGLNDIENNDRGRVDVNGMNNYITVNYADAAEQPVIDLTGAVAATVRSYTLTKWTGSDYAYEMSDAEIRAERKTVALNNDVKYKLVVNFVSGGSETYYLTLKAAATGGVLQQATGVDPNKVIDSTTGALKVPANLPIANYIASFTVTEPNATVEWTITPNSLLPNAATYKLVSKLVNGVMTIDEKESDAIPGNATTSEIGSITAIVRAQNGQQVGPAYTFSPASGTTNHVVTAGTGVQIVYNGKTVTASTSPNTVTVIAGQKVRVYATDATKTGIVKSGSAVVGTIKTAGGYCEVAVSSAMTIEFVEDANVKTLSLSAGANVNIANAKVGTTVTTQVPGFADGTTYTFTDIEVPSGYTLVATASSGDAVTAAPTAVGKWKVEITPAANTASITIALTARDMNAAPVDVTANKTDVFNTLINDRTINQTVVDALDFNVKVSLDKSGSTDVYKLSGKPVLTFDLTKSDVGDVATTEQKTAIREWWFGRANTAGTAQQAWDGIRAAHGSTGKIAFVPIDKGDADLTLFAIKSAATGTVRNLSTTYTDENGVSHTYNYSVDFSGINWD